VAPLMTHEIVGSNYEDSFLCWFAPRELGQE
jgi:hypothetical protein